MSNPQPNRESEVQPEAAPPGRIRAAISVLRGERLVPLQIQAEWAEYQVVFDGLLGRFSALLARQAKAEKKRAEALLAEPEPSQSAPEPAGKLHLWRKVHGGRPHQQSIPFQEETA